jgi:hypothetical protein
VKALTRDQIASRKEKAERFVRNVLGDEDRAAEIADESVEDYAERRKFEIINPQRRNRTMAKKNATPTRQDLLDRVAELEEENRDLADQLDAIAEIVSPGDDDSDDTDDQGDDCDENGDDDSDDDGDDDDQGS